MKLTTNPKINIPLIIKLSKECYHDYPLLADLTACQAILESGLVSVPSKLALEHCNLFGMKSGGFIKKGTAKPDGVVNLWTWEHIKGKDIQVKAGFLSNDRIEDSIEQHRQLFDGLKRYHNLKTAKTFPEIARMIKEDGYATDPHYPQKLIDIYAEYIKITVIK